MFLSLGISDSERQRRRESNKISTKINFFAWMIEVKSNKTIVICNLSFPCFFPIVCWSSDHGAGFFIVPATHSQQELKKKNYNRYLKSIIFFVN